MHRIRRFTRALSVVGMIVAFTSGLSTGAGPGGRVVAAGSFATLIDAPAGAELSAARARMSFEAAEERVARRLKRATGRTVARARAAAKARAAKIAADRRAARARLRARFIWPIRGRVTSRFGLRRSPITGQSEHHGGTDIYCPTGARIRAAKSGRVLMAQQIPIFGKVVVIRHAKGDTTFSAHLSRISVRAGRTVTQGATIGRCGSTGWATGSHLHFEIRSRTGHHYDPVKLLWPRR